MGILVWEYCYGNISVKFLSKINHPKSKRRTVERELKEKGLGTWAEAASAAEDRTAWKQRASSSNLHQENGLMMKGQVRLESILLMMRMELHRLSSPDGLVGIATITDGLGVVEIKCPFMGGKSVPYRNVCVNHIHK